MKNLLLPMKLKELRKVHSFTQDYVSSVLGVARQTYSHYETGKRVPSYEVLFKLAGLYDISVDDLLVMSIEVDRNVNYDAPSPTQSSNDLSAFLEYYSQPEVAKKYQLLPYLEKEMLYYFEKLSEDDQKEIIEFTKIKLRKSRPSAVQKKERP